jgi:hypothetical protein
MVNWKRCCAKVRDPGLVSERQCRKNAVVVDWKGRGYCAIHRPDKRPVERLRAT